MYTSKLVMALLAITSAQAFSFPSNFNFPSLSRRQTAPPEGQIGPHIAASAGDDAEMFPPKRGMPPGMPPGMPMPGGADGPGPMARPEPDHGGKGGKGWGGKPPGGPPGFPPSQGGNKCPAVWTMVSKDLTGQFLSNGMCNDLARGAIRAAFHDCASWEMKLGAGNGGCDGSLFLAKEELTRQENGGLAEVVPKLASIAAKYAPAISLADFFQFAAAHAVKTCPLGPTVQTFVGRKDRDIANPENLIPNPRASADSLVQLFQEKGISAGELAALIGAHTSAKQRVFDPKKAGAALDDTPGIWDVKFYGETIAKQAPFTIPSDIALAQHSEVGPVFKEFVNNQMGWGAAYAPAMTKLSLLGVSPVNLIDCTSALPGGSMKRQAVKRRWL